MSWSISNSRNDEASKIRWELVPYMHGRVLDLGCGGYKAFPHFVGVDNGKTWGRANADVLVDTAEKLDIFATDSCTTIFSSHLLEHLPYEDVPKALNEWMRVVKVGGQVVLYLPDEDQYPHLGDKYANPDHKWEPNYTKVVTAFETADYSWDLIDYQVRDQKDEYSLFFVFRKLAGSKQRLFSWQNQKPEKTCAVIRLGAFGDMIQTSSIFPSLKEQGYHITLYCSDLGYDVVKHDPHIDHFIIQGRDEVPPTFLGEFWHYTRQKYDKWVNLSESVECTLLAAPGRSNHEWPDSVRAKYMNRNYLEFTHELAEVPPPYLPKFYATQQERAWAKEKAKSYGRRNVIWSLSGSSGHKTWPHLDMIIARFMTDYPDVHVTLVGDKLSQILEAGWEQERRVHLRSGVWSIRESMAFCEVADLIIGPETGLLNAAGLMDTPKIVTLSHSSQEMLTKHWKHVVVLEQPKGIGCPKQPCRQIHFGWEFCPKHEETGTALCQYHIDAEMMWDAIMQVFGMPEMKVAYG